jgi:hypothetical protein
VFVLSDKHFTVDGTSIEAWAGHKSFKCKDSDRQTLPEDPGDPGIDFYSTQRSHDTPLIANSLSHRWCDL